MPNSDQRDRRQAKRDATVKNRGRAVRVRKKRRELERTLAPPKPVSQSAGRAEPALRRNLAQARGQRAAANSAYKPKPVTQSQKRADPDSKRREAQRAGQDKVIEKAIRRIAATDQPLVKSERAINDLKESGLLRGMSPRQQAALKGAYERRKKVVREEEERAEAARESQLSKDVKKIPLVGTATATAGGFLTKGATKAAAAAAGEVGDLVGNKGTGGLFKNAVQNVLDIPIQLVPGIYEQATDFGKAAKGDANAAKEITSGITDRTVLGQLLYHGDLKKAGKLAYERPVDAALELSGAKALVGRSVTGGAKLAAGGRTDGGVGPRKRESALSRFADAERADLKLAGGRAVKRNIPGTKGAYSSDATTRAVQMARDKRRSAKSEKTMVAAEREAQRAKDLKQQGNAQEANRAKLRSNALRAKAQRQDPNQATGAKLRKLTAKRGTRMGVSGWQGDVRGERGRVIQEFLELHPDKDLRDKIGAGSAPKYPTVLRAIVQSVVRNPQTLREDIEKYIALIESEYAKGRDLTPDESKNLEVRLSELKAALNDEEFLKRESDPSTSKYFRFAEEYGRMREDREAGLVEANVLREGQVPAKMIPAVVTQGLADFKPGGKNVKSDRQLAFEARRDEVQEGGKERTRLIGGLRDQQRARAAALAVAERGSGRASQRLRTAESGFKRESERLESEHRAKVEKLQTRFGLLSDRAAAKKQEAENLANLAETTEARVTKMVRDGEMFRQADLDKVDDLYQKANDALDAAAKVAGQRDQVGARIDQLQENGPRIEGSVRALEKVRAAAVGRAAPETPARWTEKGLAWNEKWDALPDDTPVWLFHATTPEIAGQLAKGVDPSAKPQTRARRRFEAGDDATFAPGAGFGSGLYVGKDPWAVSGYGRALVAVRVRKGDVKPSPEQVNLGTPPNEAAMALRVNDAMVNAPIPESDIRLLPTNGKEPTPAILDLLDEAPSSGGAKGKVDRERAALGDLRRQELKSKRMDRAQSKLERKELRELKPVAGDARRREYFFHKKDDGTLDEDRVFTVADAEAWFAGQPNRMGQVVPEGLRPIFVSDSARKQGAAAYIHDGVQPLQERNRLSGMTVKMGLGDVTWEGLQDNMVYPVALEAAARAYSRLLSEWGVGQLHRGPQGRKDAIAYAAKLSDEFGSVAATDRMREGVSDWMGDLAQGNLRLDKRDEKPAFQAVPVHPIMATADVMDGIANRIESGDLILDLDGSQALKDFLEGFGEAMKGATGDQRTEGPNQAWVVMPSITLDEINSLATGAGNILVSGSNTPFVKNLRKFSQNFRMTVLPFSTRWVFGNVAEPTAVRLPVAGIRVVHDARVAARLEKNLFEQAVFDPSKAEVMKRWQDTYFGGLHFGSVNMQNIFDPNPAIIGRTLNFNGMKHLTANVKKLQGKILDTNGKLEDQFQRAVLGKYIQRWAKTAEGRAAIKQARVSLDEIKKTNEGMAKVMEKQEEYLRAFMETGMPDPDILADAVQYSWDVLGRYAGHSPSERFAIGTYAPFMDWYRNAVYFVLWQLPVKHPLTAAMIAINDEVFAEAAREQGQYQNVFGKSSAEDIPSFLLGNPKLEDGRTLPFVRYTPFGAFQDPLNSASTLVIPQFNAVLKAMAGKNWAGDDLVMSDGSKAGTMGKTLYALNQIASSQIPGLSQFTRYREQGGTPYADSNAITPKTKPGTAEGGGHALKKIFNPLQPTDKPVDPKLKRKRRPRKGKPGAAGSFVYGGGGGGGGSSSGGSSTGSQFVFGGG